MASPGRLPSDSESNRCRRRTAKQPLHGTRDRDATLRTPHAALTLSLTKPPTSEPCWTVIGGAADRKKKGLLARNQTTHERRLMLWFARLANIGNVRLRRLAKQSNRFRVRLLARRGFNQATVLKLHLVQHGKLGKGIRGWLRPEPRRGHMAARPNARRSPAGSSLREGPAV